MMFGHLAVGLAAKPHTQRISLGVLLLAVTLIDTLVGLFMLLGIEGMQPDGTMILYWSHGLVMALVWSLLAGGIAWTVSREWGTGLIISGLVFSHWVLDFISHPMLSDTPDIPIFFANSPLVGLGLYRSALGAFSIDFGLLIVASAYYLLRTRPIDQIGRWAFPAMLVFTFAIIPLAMLPGRWAGLGLLLMNLPLLGFGIWIDQHRRPFDPGAMRHVEKTA